MTRTLPEWIAGVVTLDHRTNEFRSISSEFSNSLNVPRFYAISKILREGFDGFRTKGTFNESLKAS
jgi:hypothetical protein